MNNLWIIIVGVVSTLLGMFFNERTKRVKAEENSGSSEDKLLQYKQQETQTSIADQQKDLATLEKNHDQSTKETSNLTPEQVEQYWNKRKDS